jgi:PAS domain-containing protein
LKHLANPIFLRGAVVFCCSAFAFVLGLIFMRLLRKSIQEEGEISSEGTPMLEALPMHLYNTVIQQLKQQKQELQVQSQAELSRARASETFSHAVLTNLSCGVLVFGANGLVKTSNPAAREILGFGSATGMGIEDIFRGAVLRDEGPSAHTSPTQDAAAVFPVETLDEPTRLADEVDAVLHLDANSREVHAEYETPAGDQRFIAVRISPVPAADGGLLGVACLINDLSEQKRMHHEQEMRGELSAEMALHLRTSLTTISGYAQQLASSRDSELAKQLAADIAGEAASLDRTLGGFLTGKNPAQSAARGATSST